MTTRVFTILFLLLIFSTTVVWAEGNDEPSEPSGPTDQITPAPTPTPAPPPAPTDKCSSYSTRAKCIKSPGEASGDTILECLWCSGECRPEKGCIDADRNPDAANRELGESCPPEVYDLSEAEFEELYTVSCDHCTGKWECQLKINPENEPS